MGICGGRGAEYMGPLVVGGRRDSHEGLLRIDSIGDAEEHIAVDVLGEMAVDVVLHTPASLVGVVVDEEGLANSSAGCLDMGGRSQELLCCRYIVHKGIRDSYRHQHMVEDSRPWMMCIRSMKGVSDKVKNDANIASSRRRNSVCFVADRVIACNIACTEIRHACMAWWIAVRPHLVERCYFCLNCPFSLQYCRIVSRSYSVDCNQRPCLPVP